MKNLIVTKPFPSLTNLHSADESTVIEFLNNTSKELGAIKYLGAFIDDVKLIRDIGLRINLDYIIVERSEYSGERAGQEYNKTDGTTDIFEINYDLPDFVNKTTKEERYVILSTVETYSCPTLEKCSKCNGSGRCTSCEARGYNRCIQCEGSGKKSVREGQNPNGTPKYKTIACSSCHGSGKRTCTNCNGTGRCSKCDGSGKVTCRRCDGTGYYQTYFGYTNKYDSGNRVIHRSAYDYLENPLSKGEGSLVYEDGMIEWINESKMLFDNRDTTKKVNKYVPEVIDNIEKLIPITSNQRVGRIYAKCETIPITIINYCFENTEYQITIVGQNNILCYINLPKKHSYKQNVLKRIIKFFNKKKREIAFAYIASFMFHADDEVAKEELNLLETLINSIKLRHEKRSALINILTKKLSIEEVKPNITCLMGDKRALVFAWHCVIQDKEIKPSEIQAFNQLLSMFKIKETEIDKIKHKATKFAQLKDAQMLEEYFK